VSCIENGFIQRQIENSAYEYQQEIEKNERIIVGLNRFEVEETTKPALLRVDPLVGETQVKGLQQIRSTRDNQKVGAALAGLLTAATGTENLMPHILDAVREYASLGEICGVLREVFGEYRG
jgi:methylmalonyl-CoA mutase N-terminal domain/subunit